MAATDDDTRGFAMLPNWIALDPSIGHTTMRVLLAVAGLARSKGHTAADNAKLGRLTGLKPDTVKRALADLEARGIVAREMDETGHCRKSIRLVIERGGRDVHPGGVGMCIPGGRDVHPGGRDVHPPPSIISEELKEQQHAGAGAHAREGAPDPAGDPLDFAPRVENPPAPTMATSRPGATIGAPAGWSAPFSRGDLAATDDDRATLAATLRRHRPREFQAEHAADAARSLLEQYPLAWTGWAMRRAVKAKGRLLGLMCFYLEAAYRAGGIDRFEAQEAAARKAKSAGPAPVAAPPPVAPSGPDDLARLRAEARAEAERRRAAGLPPLRARDIAATNRDTEGRDRTA